MLIQTRGMIFRMRQITITVMVLIFGSQILWAQDTPDILQNESAPGARAAMGLFANGYSRALLNELFLVERYSWEEALGSAALAAAGYQILSYNTATGLELKPFKLNKEWYGYWQGYLAGEGLNWFLYWAQSSREVQLIIWSTVGLATATVVIIGASKYGFRMADDGPLTLENLFTNRHSYWIHFAGSGGLYWAISNHSNSAERSLLYTTGLIWLWELKDGYIPWEEAGFIGGDGFSWRDGTAGTIAALGSYGLDKWVLPWIRTHIIKTGSLSMSVNRDYAGLNFRLCY